MDTSLLAKRALYKIIKRHQSEGSLNLGEVRNDYKRQQKTGSKTFRSFSALLSKKLDFSAISDKKEVRSLKRLSIIPEYPIKTRKLARKENQFKSN